jgi:hypothetical protein
VACFTARLRIARTGYSRQVTAPTPEPSDRYYYGNENYNGSYYEDEPPAAAPRPRRRRHRGRNWTIVLVVLIGLLIGADRVAAAVAENQLASKIQQSQKLSQQPSVSIGGFPFLTQVLSRNFGHATIDINNLNSRGVPISHIHADLRGVHVSSGYNSATVDTLNSTASLTYAAISTAVTNNAGVGPVTIAQGSAADQVKAGYNLAAGVAVTADVQVNLLSGNVLEFKGIKLHTALGTIGLNQNLFDTKVPLTGLPFGMQLKTLQITAAGLDITATGQNVALTGNSVSLTN